MNDAHIPVLLDEVVSLLLPENHSVHHVIDGTVGAGGHTRALLEAGANHVLGMDLDADALALARQNLASFAGQVHLVHDSYANMKESAAALGWHNVDAILLDLGVSSMQLDTPERGFAFMADGPLDMRFNPQGNQPPASELVNQWDELDLTAIFARYGEERYARRIAHAVVENRPYETTGQLAKVVEEAVPRGYDRRRDGQKSIHPATRVFQALRIAVNEELTTIERTLPRALDLLKPGGRLAIISFHSLEDRVVKHTFKEASLQIISPPGMVLDEKVAQVRLITSKPVNASDEEVARNPRSRSAKLRVVEKL